MLSAHDYMSDIRPRRQRRQRQCHVTAPPNLHHLLAYDYSDAAGGGTFQSGTAYTDQSFTTRNGHYMFSEPYRLLASAVLSTHATDARLNMPSINNIGYHHLWGVMRSATVASPQVIEDYRSSPMPLPMWEEMDVQMSDNSGAAEHVETFLVIAPPTWNLNAPGPGDPNSVVNSLTLKFTATVNTGAYSWSGLTPLVFESTLKGGWYSVLGMEVEGANLLAYQINFPRFPLVQGRKLLPGFLALNAIGNIPTFYDRKWLGWWGTFASWEVPQIQGISAAGGNISCTGYVDLLYHGYTPPPQSISGSTAGISGMGG
jgi:hypothetical protein